LYERLAQVYNEIESVPGSLEKIRIFSEILKESEPSTIDKLIALTIGKLHPDWKGEPEMGVAEKMACH
jgi:DNA ligase-1